MPQFVLDESGSVDMADGKTLQFRDLDDFTQGYVECLFFLWPDDSDSEDESDAERPHYVGGITSPAFGEFAPDALATVIQDCAAFQSQNADLLESAYARDYDERQAGRDFYFTRNGSGVGYWDRDELEPQGEDWEATEIPLDQWTPEIRATRERLKAESIGQRLTDACRAWRELNPYLGDDSKVYLG